MITRYHGGKNSKQTNLKGGTQHSTLSNTISLSINSYLLLLNSVESNQFEIVIREAAFSDILELYDILIL